MTKKLKFDTLHHAQMNRKIIKKSGPTIMGILNLTPDSFSDGGAHNTLQKALKRVEEMEDEGADIIDIGGESTGPNSKKISAQEEINRIIPILKEIKKITSLPISIDTYKAEVARIAIEEGASIINDVTALRGDKKMGELIKKHKLPVIIMYSKDKTPRATLIPKNYKNVIKSIKTFLEERIEFAKKIGIKKEQIIIDPGMGAIISSIPKYSFEVIAKLNSLKTLSCPILIGISRKSFLGGDINSRDEKSAILSAIAYINGASIIRTHNIKETKLCLQQV